MSTRDKLALGVVGFVGVIVVVLITRFSTDALGVIVGVALAMAGTIPALAVVAWLAGRQSRYAPPRHDPYHGYPPEAMYYRRLAPPRRPYAPPSRRLPARRGGVVVAPGYAAPRQRETALWLPRWRLCAAIRRRRGGRVRHLRAAGDRLRRRLRLRRRRGHVVTAVPQARNPLPRRRLFAGAEAIRPTHSTGHRRARAYSR
ncbi:MAG: hypothetical protein M5R40_20775 [Anaerolineae bacterium]|nr:hypothetical protein [Anaerolineae bacterium]